MAMSPNEAGARIAQKVAVTREDIARAKDFVLQRSRVTGTDRLAHEWLTEQTADVRDVINTDAADCDAVVESVARAFSLRMALYMAVWELSTVGELLPAHTVSEWKPSLTYMTPRGAGGILVPGVNCFYLPEFFRPPAVTGVPADPDIFLTGVDTLALHPGIREAIEQSLDCFRRGLYLPSTVMLAAAAEATWTECGEALAKRPGSSKLARVTGDQFASISKKVSETRKALEQADGQLVLKAAGVPMPKVDEAVVWTTVLRDRRNALHWGKAKSFIADHSGTAALLMAAPLHLGTLESIRTAC